MTVNNTVVGVSIQRKRGTTKDHKNHKPKKERIKVQVYAKYYSILESPVKTKKLNLDNV